MLVHFPVAFFVNFPLIISFLSPPYAYLYFEAGMQAEHLKRDHCESFLPYGFGTVIDLFSTEEQLAVPIWLNRVMGTHATWRADMCPLYPSLFFCDADKTFLDAYSALPDGFSFPPLQNNAGI